MSAIGALVQAWCHSLDSLGGGRPRTALLIEDPEADIDAAMVVRNGQAEPLGRLSDAERRRLSPADVKLGPRGCFSRRVRLAWPARFQAREVVALRMGSLSPRAPDDTAFAIHSVLPLTDTGSSAAQQGEALVRIADRAALAGLTERLAAAGIKAVGIDSEWPDQTFAPVDLTRGRRRVCLPGSPSRLAVLSLSGLAALALLAQGLLLLYPPPAPEPVTARVQPLDPALTLGDLASLSRTLGDQEWLETVEADANSIVLRGIASDPADLSRRLSAAGFLDVRILESSRDANGRDRFQISLGRPQPGPASGGNQ